MFDFHGKKALVTGAGARNGIGFASAQLLASLGASVYITATTDRAAERVGELRAAGYDAHGSVVDLTDESATRNLAALALNSMGGLDVLVNNAGMTSQHSERHVAKESGGIDEMDVDGFQRSLLRNVTSAFSLTKLVIPEIRKSPHGRIIMMASVTGPHMAMRHQVAYATSKAAMVGMVRALALDEAAGGVTVNAIAPGWIATDSQGVEEARQGTITPMRRSAHPDEIASAVAWLASSGASYITGQSIVIDGGNSIMEERI
jgi:3-oxoacyl-[acyl-carrier protein] reductase